MSDQTALLVDLTDGVLTLTNNDAPRNRMSFAYMDALEEQVIRAGEDPDVRVLVFTAEGTDHFSVGMDLKQLMAEGPKRGVDNVLDQRRRVLGMIENLPKPSIATLFGYCLGGGLELPLACHFRFAAATGAQIGLPELDLGTVPAWGGTARLVRTVGRDHALDMILRAKKIDGPRALEIGLVQEVVEDVDAGLERARALAARVARNSPTAVATFKAACLAALGLPGPERQEIEARAYEHCLDSGEAAIGRENFAKVRAGEPVPWGPLKPLSPEG